MLILKYRESPDLVRIFGKMTIILFEKLHFFIHLFSDDTYFCVEKNKRVRILEQSANKSVFYKIPGGKCQKNWGEHWVGITKSYVIIRVGQQKSYVCLQGGWVGPKKAQIMLT